MPDAAGASLGDARTAPSNRRSGEFVLLAAGVLLVALSAAANRHNDGLWYQGDSPRHALNGLFWKDFLTGGHLTSPQQFAFDYYRQYQAIAPTVWPPFFYLCEAVAYHVFGIDVSSAKLVVLLFAVLYTVYLLKFLAVLGITPLGRWIALLGHTQPAFYLWTNAVMLDMPALALGVASVYHVERARRTDGRLHLILAVAFLVAATLTRPTGCILPLAYIAACLATGHGRRFLARDAALVGGAGALLVLPWIYVQFTWGSGVVAEATKLGQHSRWSLRNWTYYLDTLGDNVNWWFSVLAAIGIVLGLIADAHRDITRRIALTTVVLLLLYTLIQLKDARYVIGVLPLMAAAIAIGASQVGDRISSGRRLVTPASALMVFASAWLWVHRPPAISGFRAAVEDVVARYPGQRLVYDGFFDGNFIFYFRTSPARDDVRVFRGGKVFYATALHKEFGLMEFVQRGDDVARILGNIGCRYVLLEREEVVDVEVARIVRAVVTRDTGLFRFLRTYPVQTPQGRRVTNLDLYEFTGPLSAHPDESLVFPALGLRWR